MSDEKKPKVGPIREEKPGITMKEAGENMAEAAKEVSKHAASSENATRKPKPKVNPRIRKEPFLSRLKNTLFGDDANNVGSYILWDVLIPAAKDTIQDMVTKGIEMMLFGESTGRSRNRRPSATRGQVVSYGNYYRGSRESRGGSRDRSVRSPGISRRLDDVIFDYEEEASEVHEFLIEMMDQYGQVSVADFYEVAGLTAYSEYTDNSIGWDRPAALSRARVVRVRDGYQLVLPQPQRLG